MKTISIPAKEVKSKPLSLSKAARYLKKFVESDSGASEANLGFLKRASAAFNELNTFQKEIERSKSRSRRKAGGDEVVGLIEDGKSGGERSEVVLIDEKERKKKKKQREGVEDGGAENSKKSDRTVEMGGSTGKAKNEVDGRKRNKSENGEEEGRLEDSEERGKSKKKRRKNKEEDA